MDKGQSKFISALHNKYSPLLIQLTYRRTGDAELSKSIIRETFLVACCKVDVVCNHKNPVGWLFCLLNNLTMREMKKANDLKLSLCFGNNFKYYENDEIDTFAHYVPNEAESKIKSSITAENLLLDKNSIKKNSSIANYSKRTLKALKICREFIIPQRIRLFKDNKSTEYLGIQSIGTVHHDISSKCNSEILKELEIALRSMNEENFDIDFVSKYLFELQDKFPVMTDYSSKLEFIQLKNEHPFLFKT